MVKVDIIVPVYFAPEFVIRCIQSIFLNTDFKSFDVKIIVVEDSANEKNTHLLQYFFEKLDLSDKLIFLTHKENSGFIEACYTGIDYRESDYKILLNSDTVVTRGWLNYMIETAESDDKIALVNPITNQSRENNVLIPPGHNINTMREFFENQKARESENSDQIIVGGVCLLIKSKYIKEYGFFDRIFDIGYCEDYDLYFRYLTQGLRGVISPKAFVYHKGEASFGDRVEYFSNNYKLFMARYGGVYNGVVNELKERSILNCFRSNLKCASSLNIDVLLVSPVNTLYHGGVKVIHNMCNALNEQGISASMVCEDIIEPTSLEDRLYNPILIKDLYLLDIKPKVIAFSLIYNASEVASLVDHIKSKHNYTPKIVHLMQDIESWFEGHKQSDLEVCTAIANSKLIVSPFIEEYFADNVNKGVDSKVIKNTISLDFINMEKESEQRPFTICAMLRTDQKRGAILIEEAIRRLSSFLSEEINFITFGDYKMPSNYEHINLRELGKISENEVNKVMKGSDLFLEASFYHGYGMASMEALFSGCYVLSSNNKGAVSVLPESDMIEYFQIGNSIELCNKILNKIESWNGVRKNLSKGQLFENSTRFIYPKYISYFKKVISEIDSFTDKDLYRKFFLVESKLRDRAKSVEPSESVHVNLQEESNTALGSGVLVKDLLDSYREIQKPSTFIKYLRDHRERRKLEAKFFYYDIVVEESNDRYAVHGWCFHLLEKISAVELIFEQQDGSNLKISGSYGQERADVSKYFQTDNAFSCGFKIKVSKSEMSGSNNILVNFIINERETFKLSIAHKFNYLAQDN